MYLRYGRINSPRKGLLDMIHTISETQCILPRESNTSHLSYFHRVLVLFVENISDFFKIFITTLAILC